jgi:beta-glucosidase-like glycosyl hydrolase
MGARVRPFLLLVALAAGLLGVAPAAQDGLPPLDREARRWVDRTLASLSIDERVGQVLASSFFGTYSSSDSAAFDTLKGLVEEQRLGGFLVFGGRVPSPGVLLNPTYPAVTLGDPFAAASMFNRLQALSKVPLLNSGDFETSVAFRLAGATAFPRAMAFGAAGDERLAYEAGRINAVESRALGVHLVFGPVADVNNNPNNPVINTRSFGEDPEQVAKLSTAFARGLQVGGVIATLKHFPGHGDTDVDSHLGLPRVPHERARLDAVELLPFRRGIAAGVGAVMVGHLVMPAIDPAPDTPSTLSGPIVTGLLREQLGFQGLTVTDSMQMEAITKAMPPGEAAARAFAAGNDIVLHSPDDRAAYAGIRDAVAAGRIPAAQLEASVRRVLEAKARLGLHVTRRVDLEAIATTVGTRAHAAVADEVSQRAVTLLRDEPAVVPLALPAQAQVLYVSALDTAGNWGIAAPGRALLADLRARDLRVTAVELSDRTTPGELELLRSTASRYDAIIVGAFVRVASGTGRVDLAPGVVSTIAALARSGAAAKVPVVGVIFGSPYAVIGLPSLPSVLLTYDLYDRAERSAARALFGERAIGGKVPVLIPGVATIGDGLVRAPR